MKPTMNLRFVEREVLGEIIDGRRLLKKVKILQQQFKDESTGNTIWVDVKIEEEL